MSENKNPVGRPAINATPITVRVPPELLAALDRVMPEIGAETRPEAVRMILRDWLEGFDEKRDGRARAD
ncbi:ribbon-helix-helix domain-containing protein [Jiella avicenniae]|uniref:Ribbon-helix-helix domain-containing protein n=1 Tax=Jiella avicenniae TaxID=2907202 RepID=A0A9X1NVT9_9HYPH|nr:ribbon-helix-helix domain-containing protein [Jiella avicenniae]MCE7026432.1 ribbon-helix-helix domain-containing protein [Jiella avicenniae]